VSGNVEMRYDPEARRVVYQPVTIEPRALVQRVVREEKYGDSEAAGENKGTLIGSRRH
jgi:NADH-quinone oxidoreductase subunit C